MIWAAIFAVVWLACVLGLLAFCRAASAEPPSPPDRGLRIPESPAPFDVRTLPGMAGACPEPVDLTGLPWDPIAEARLILKESTS